LLFFSADDDLLGFWSWMELRNEERFGIVEMIINVEFGDRKCKSAI
jgi:hypothetical protein